MWKHAVGKVLVTLAQTCCWLWNETLFSLVIVENTMMFSSSNYSITQGDIFFHTSIQKCVHVLWFSQSKLHFLLQRTVSTQLQNFTSDVKAQIMLHVSNSTMCSQYWIRWMDPVELDMSNMALMRIAGSIRGDVQLPFNYVNTSAFVLWQALPLCCHHFCWHLSASLSSPALLRCLGNMNIYHCSWHFHFCLSTSVTPSSTGNAAWPRQNLVETTTTWHIRRDKSIKLWIKAYFC